MAYYFRSVRSRFVLPRVNEEKALAALKARNLEVAIFDGAPIEDEDEAEPAVAASESLEDALELWGWRLDRGADGDIEAVGIESGQVGGGERGLLEVLAPFVRGRAFIQLRGEDGADLLWEIDERGQVRCDTDR